jgi:catechol 2,3-dioxygenase-like lactoylglutathione lyase family enzyme
MPTITGLSHVDLTVTDLDKSADWYTKLLGLNLALEGASEEQGFKAKYLIEPGTSFIVGLVEHTSGGGKGFDARVTGLDHLSLAVSNRDELRAWQGRLDELGIAHEGISEQGVGAGLNFRDPDGIALEFYVIDLPAPVSS